MKRYLVGLMLLTACGSAGGAADAPAEPSSPLETAYDICVGTSANPRVSLQDDGQSLTVDGVRENADAWVATFTETACILTETGTPDYVVSQMENTTSLMGLQEATWDSIEATWSFHPDNGFDVVLHMV